MLPRFFPCSVMLVGILWAGLPHDASAEKRPRVPVKTPDVPPAVTNVSATVTGMEDVVARVRAALLARRGLPRDLTAQLESAGSRTLGRDLMSLGIDRTILEAREHGKWSRILLSLRHPETVAGYVDMLSADDVRVRLSALSVLAKMTDGRAQAMLEQVIRDDPDSELARRAEWAIILSWPPGETVWRERLKDPSPIVRCVAAGALARTGTEAAMPDLDAGARDADPLVRAAVRNARKALHDRANPPRGSGRLFSLSSPRAPVETYAYQAASVLSEDGTQLILDVLHADGWYDARGSGNMVYTFVRGCLLVCKVDTGQWRVAFRRDFKTRPRAFHAVHATSNEVLVAEEWHDRLECYWVDLASGRRRPDTIGEGLKVYSRDALRSRARERYPIPARGVGLNASVAGNVTFQIQAPEQGVVGHLFTTTVNWRSWR